MLSPLWVWAMPVLMFLSVVFLVVETPRYRTPIDPFLVLLAAAAVTAGWERARALLPLARDHEVLRPRERQEARRRALGDVDDGLAGES